MQLRPAKIREIRSVPPPLLHYMRLGPPPPNNAQRPASSATHLVSPKNFTWEVTQLSERVVLYTTPLFRSLQTPEKSYTTVPLADHTYTYD